MDSRKRVKKEERIKRDIIEDKERSYRRNNSNRRGVIEEEVYEKERRSHH